MTAGSVGGIRNLEKFLADGVLADVQGARITRLQRIPGGGLSHEHFLCQISGVTGGRPISREIVLRRVPRTGPLEPYDVTREFHVMRLLSQTEVPVPQVYGRCLDPSVFERPFLVMEYVPGEIYDYRNIHEHGFWHDERERRAMAIEIVGLLGRLQRAHWKEMGFQRYLPAPEGPLGPPRRLLDHWAWMYARHAPAWCPVPTLRDALLWLQTNLPECDEPVLVHGDFRVGNFVWQGRRIVSVLDWEGCSIGDPMQDLAYFCHPIQRERAPQLMGMLIEQDELFKLYDEICGRPVDLKRFRYYLVYALFFHGVTILVGFDQAMTGETADFRITRLYRRLNKVTRYLCAELEKVG